MDEIRGGGISRRTLLRVLGLGGLSVLGARGSPALARAKDPRRPPQDAGTAEVTLAAAADPVTIRLAATDGYIRLPGRGSPLHPGEDPETMSVGDPLYVFGFVLVPGDVSPDQLDVFKGGVQHPAPIIGVDAEADVYLTMTNIGLVVRPDLDDSHTVHWHGFPNATAIFDGVPEASISVPVGRSFPYYYKPHRPGTFMYHCHFEDVEHVQMGMQGTIFVRPAQNGTAFEHPPGSGKIYTRFAYDDGDGSTGYDREFALHLDEKWTVPHDNLESIQETVWPKYRANYWLLNGRSYPDTLKPNNDPSLPAQPLSSLVQVEEGERVLLRFSNLGYEQQSIQLPGIPMRVVGEDASLLRNGSVDLSYLTNTIYIGPGEARDVLFTAPPHSGGSGPDVYWLMNREPHKLTNDGLSFGGQVTQVQVFPSGALGPQAHPNQTYPEPSPTAPYVDPWVV